MKQYFDMDDLLYYNEEYFLEDFCKGCRYLARFPPTLETSADYICPYIVGDPRSQDCVRHKKYEKIVEMVNALNTAIAEEMI